MVRVCYTILATLVDHGRIHVYVNAPGTKGKFLGKEKIVARSAFPAALFK
jgi:hypothetical protein